MNLRTKIFLLIGSIWVIFFSGVIFFTSYKLTKDFSSVEQSALHKNLDRVTDALNEKISSLAIKLGDWAQWDDSYQFMIDHNEDYTQSNLGESAFGILHINFVVFIDKDNNIIFEKFVKDGDEKPFPESFDNHLTEDFTEGDINLNAAHKEIVSLPEQMVIYVAQPIISSDGLSPANGVLVFGYIFDATTVEALSQLTHLDITMVPFENRSGQTDGFEEARNNLSLKEPHYVGTAKDSKIISGYVLVSDATDEPVFIFRVDMPREVYQKGQNSIFLFTLSFVLAGIVFCGIIFYLLGYFVLNKLLYLNDVIDQMHRSGDMRGEIALPGKDEFSRLAEGMNHLRLEVNENEVKLKDQNKDLEQSKMITLNILEDVSESERELHQRTVDLSKFQKIADASFDNIIITDVDGKILYANYSVENMTGYSHKEIIGANPSLWGKQMSQEFYAQLWQTIKTEKQSFAGEITNKHKKGNQFLVAARITPIIDENENIQFFVGIARDITEERRTQIQIMKHATELETSNILIEKQKDRAESILGYLQSIGEGVFATDINGKIIFVNETAKVLIGEQSQTIEGKVSRDIFQFLRKVGGENTRVFMAEKVLKKKNTIIFPENTSLIQKDGTLLPVSGTISLIENGNNEIIGTITVFQDVTNRHELDQLKESFLSVAAHQLRTPLGSMRWSMEMLLSDDLGKLPKDAKEMVEQLYANSHRMVELVDDLLDISRIDKNRGKEEKIPTDVISVLEDVIKTMQSEAKKRAIKIIFNHPKESVPALMVPAKHLYEALENLISNGIKYNREKGTLTITVEMTEKSLLLIFADTGIGIPKDDQTKIFSKFFRAQNAILKETEGSGLGLSVVKSYLEESEATIRFESEENRGTTFFIDFPFTPIQS